MKEEMGMKCKLTDIFNFIYKEKLDNELTEHELDHVFVGYSEEIPNFNPEEVCDYQYISFDDLKKDIHENPGKYTYWFKHVFKNVQKHIIN